ncbi:DUF1800 domain-containing protein [Rhodoferax sp.]|uniref:DUF1800 domain-containing protein n=1 Tax=Rhodoferax sp. TaxID=50421 RepID=UPI002ACD6CF5|nr:DUF1800 domain-containing protein [Rhodoferax sp.]MDZ7921291.1 DUF1800 domain-containing protein [Rhodoferax sp.]
MRDEDTDILATEVAVDGAAERWVQRAALTGVAGLLTACATPGGRLLQRPGQQYSRAQTPEEATRFLLQAQFSASDAEISAVQNGSYADWLAQQFDAPRGQTGWDWLNKRGYGAIDNTTRYFDHFYPGDYMVWNQLMTAPDAVRKRLALALSEFFVVSLTGLDFAWRSHAMAHYWDTLARYALGNFRELLEEVTLNPAMGHYLNTKGNQKENAATGRVPDENYAREVMQLFTIGLVQLNPDGSEKTGANGQRLETYTQSDVTHLARVFTGYDFDQRNNVVTPFDPEGKRKVGNTNFARQRMLFTPNRHSEQAVRFLGITIPAKTSGGDALKVALDTLFQHPNVGPFFGKQMIQRLVTSNPSPAYVARVAAAFADNGAGVRGDLRAVFAAILLDDEARSPAGLTDPRFGRLREPMLRLVQWGRTFGITSAQGSWKIGDLSNPATQLGQSPLRSPSVFNFFRPGYVPPATQMAAAGVSAPEFQIVTESSVAGYINYLQGVVRNGIHVNDPDLPNNVNNSKSPKNGFDIKASYNAELALAPDAKALVARLNLLLCAGQLPAALQARMVTALNATPITAASPPDKRLDRVAAAVLLTMAAPQYLVQK